MSFISLLLYLFCTFIRPQDWVPVFYELPLVNWLAIATTFFIFTERITSKSIRLIKVPQNIMILGLFVAILMSNIVHTYMEGLTLAWDAFLVIFLLYFIVLNAVNTELKFKIAIWFIVLMILVLVPQGIYQVQNGYGWAGQAITFDPDRNESRINWIGIFNDPNDLALLFVVAIGIVIAFLFGKTNFFVRVFCLAAISALGYGIFLTNSRGGMLALAATVYFYFIRRTRKFVLGSIIAGIIIAGLFAVGPSRIGLISAEEDSAYSRLDLWYEGIQMMKSNPVFGVGYGMFTDELPQTAHNSFVLAAAELGFVGLFCFVGLLYCSFRALSFVQGADPKLLTLATGLQSSLIGYSTAAFFLSRTYVILPYLLFALSGSLFFIAQKNSNIVFNLTRHDFWKIFWMCWGILLLILTLVKIGL